MSKLRVGTILLVLILAIGISGCSSGGISSVTKKNPAENQLIKVRIYFGGGDTVDGYVKEMGIESTGKVYAGGSSSTPLYDAQGNITGTCNYQRVLYMQILPENMEPTS